MRMPMRGERGFTLIELLIVIAILAVLAAIVIPSIMGAFGRGAAQAFEGDKDSIQTAVSSYWYDNGGGSSAWPTADPDGGGPLVAGNIPGRIDYNRAGPITGDALVPRYLTEIPQSQDLAYDGNPTNASGGHYTWAIDSTGLVGYWVDDGDSKVEDDEVIHTYNSAYGYP